MPSQNNIDAPTEGQTPNRTPSSVWKGRGRPPKDCPRDARGRPLTEAVQADPALAAAPPALASRRGVRRYNPEYIIVHQPSGRASGLSYEVNAAGIALVEKMARDGHDVVTLAAQLGIHHVTFADIRKRQPEVGEAWARGRASLGDEINDILLKQARKGNMTAAIFLAKGRLGWREVGPTDPNAQQSNINITINAPLTDDEWQRMVKVSRDA